jgi:hypothetical protein
MIAGITEITDEGRIASEESFNPGSVSVRRDESALLKILLHRLKYYKLTEMRNSY